MRNLSTKQLTVLPSGQVLTFIDALFREATEGIMIEDGSGRIIAVNAALLQFLEKDEKELIGSPMSALAYLIGEKEHKNIVSTLKKENFWRGELEIATKRGRKRLVKATADLLDEEGSGPYKVYMFTDISEIKYSRQQLEYIATHDTLTKLPNRVLLYDRLKVSIERVQRSDSIGAVIFLDIDRFKDINDNFGHIYGDELLKICAGLLTSSLRAKDTVGRLGGDEFLIIIDDFYALQDIEEVSIKLLVLFDRLIKVHDAEFDLSVSMGIAVYPDNGNGVEALINKADRAMAHIKQTGRNNYSFYSPELSDQSQELFHVGRAIKQALRSDSFYLAYQPQISLSSGMLTGAEALVRCSEKSLADIGTEHLVTIAEKSSLILELGKRVFELACEQIDIWNREGTPPCLIAVNLSRRQLSDRKLVSMIEETLERFNVGIHQIEFEITESSLIQSHILAKQNVQKLRELGFRFSIDDFGTGYSSLSNLRHFSLDKLKIDRSFITEIEENRHDRIIVEATINMAKSLGLVVLAEGVENEAQIEILRGFGCDEIQGYLYSRPLASKAFELLFRQEGPKL